MAISRFSTPIQLDAPRGSVDVNAFDNTLGYKDAKIDEGFALVNASIKAINALPTGRPQDKAYKDQKVNELVSTLNTYGDADLSNPRVVAQMQLEAESLAQDAKLVGIVRSARNEMQYEERLAKMKENPKLMPYYSDINEWNDRQQIAAWKRGELEYNGLATPTFYKDVDKTAGDVLKQLAPKEYSYVDGLHIVNGQVKTSTDLQTLALNLAESDPSVSNQLRRNSEFLYRNYTPEQLRETAIEARRNNITQAKKDLDTYQNKIKDASISKEEKASMQQRVGELTTSIKDAESNLAEFSSRELSPSEMSGIKYSLYANNWVKSVSQPYVVSKTKLTADQAGLTQLNIASKAELETRRQQFTAQQNQLNREADLFKEEFKAATQFAKEGKTFDRDHWRQTGEVRATDGMGVGGTTLSDVALQPEFDAVVDLDSTINSLNSTNKNLITQTTLDIVRSTDPTLAGKLDKIYKAGGDISSYKGEMSVAQINLLSQYDQLLKDASDPEKLKANPLLPQYGAVANTITTNMLKSESLKRLKDDATKQVYEQAKKDGFKGSESDFNNVLNKETVGYQEESKLKDDNSFGAMLARSAQGMTPSQQTSGAIGVGKYKKQINETLKKSPRANEFYTTQFVGEKDSYNQGAKVQQMLSLVNQTGIKIGGETYSINGSIADNISHRGDKSNVVQVKVNSFTPLRNEANVTLMVMEDGKVVPKESGTITMNPTQMTDVFGINSSRKVESIHPFLNDGVMTDSKGAPLYYNLNGDLPNMMGNIEYRFFDAGDGRSLGMSLNIPVNGRMTEVHLPQRFTGDGAHLNAKSALIESYNKAYRLVTSQNPTATPAEISKLTLQYIYNQF